ncbi:HAD family phosphatase [Lachnospiraceae bacterium 54-53]
MGVISDEEFSCVKGVIFDFNGTLFWDSDQQELAWRNFAKEIVHREITDFEFQEYIHGRSNDFIFEYLFGRPLPQEERIELSEQKEKLYRQLCIDQLPFQLAPGAAELLEKLKTENIPRAIETAPRDCIVFEDAVSGIRAANAAGIGKIIAVLPEGDQEHFRNMHEVHTVISTFNEFLDNDTSWHIHRPVS